VSKGSPENAAISDRFYKVRISIDDCVISAWFGRLSLQSPKMSVSQAYRGELSWIPKCWRPRSFSGIQLGHERSLTERLLEKPRLEIDYYSGPRVE